VVLKSPAAARVSCRTRGLSCCASSRTGRACRPACRRRCHRRWAATTGAASCRTWRARSPTGPWVISDFRVMGDQRELFGPVASVPAAWRALKEIAAGGDRRRRKITAAVGKARRHAWAHGIARHGGLPPVKVADRRLEGVTCIRLDATVVTAHSDKELAEPDFKGYGLLPGHRGLR
jgi:hypothetical protein